MNTFEFYRLRLRYVASEPVSFPPAIPANVLRGALGTVFRRVACAPDCSHSEDRHSPSCPYVRVFEPSALEGGPSGLTDRPRPFVFRARHLDGLTVGPGQEFSFDLHLFLLDPQVLEFFILSFLEIGKQGVGPGRGRAELVCASQLDLEDKPVSRLYHSGKISVCPSLPASISLHPRLSRSPRVGVDFLTPTELKAGRTTATQPAFDVLFARVRDRISTLSALYGPGSLAIDFKGMAERAALVRMTRCDLHKVRAERRSSRTGQTHPLGGFVGFAEYEGDLTEFLPCLEAGQWTGVGRQTVWGKGEIRLRFP